MNEGSASPTSEKRRAPTTEEDAYPKPDSTPEHRVYNGIRTSRDPGSSLTPTVRSRLRGLDSLEGLIEARKITSGQDFDSILQEFERKHGRVLDAYFPRGGLMAGAVLTAPNVEAKDRGKRKLLGKRKLFVRLDRRDLALQAKPYDEAFWLMVLTAQQAEHHALLSPEARRVVSGILFAEAQHLLGALDNVSKGGEKERLSDEDVERLHETAEAARGRLDELKKYVDRMAVRTALRYYVLGLPVGLLAVGSVILYMLRSVESTLDRNLFIASIAAGAIGSVTSVMSRITRGQTLTVHVDEGPFMTVLGGIFRALVGAIFGVALYVLVQAELLPLDDTVGSGKDGFFYGGLAFLAGFSERWAQDTILQSRPIAPSPAGARSIRVDDGAAAAEQTPRRHGDTQ